MATKLEARLLPEERHRAARVQVRGLLVVDHDQLFRFHEIGHVASIVGAPHIESRARPIDAQARDQRHSCVPMAWIQSATLWRRKEACFVMDKFFANCES